jgi:hypothetical protein
MHNNGYPTVKNSTSYPVENINAVVTTGVTFERIADWLNSSVEGKKKVGIDFGGTFEFQNMIGDFKLLARAPEVEIVAYAIDTKAELHRKPYFPNDVVIGVGEGENPSRARYAVAQRASLYVSQQELSIERTKEAYKVLTDRIARDRPRLAADLSSVYRAATHVLDSVRGANTVFDVQNGMNRELLRLQLGDSLNIRITHKEPDRFKPEIGGTGHGMPHMEEDVVIYALAKEGNNGTLAHMLDEIRRGLETGSLDGRRQIFAIAENANSLFTVPADPEVKAFLTGALR